MAHSIYSVKSLVYSTLFEMEFSFKTLKKIKIFNEKYERLTLLCLKCDNITKNIRKVQKLN